MRGILSAAGYVPYRRLNRADIKAFMGSGGGKGTRPWPPTTRTRRRSGSRRPGWRCAPPLVTLPIPSGSPPRVPAYLDKTNATAVAAALRLPGGRRRLRLRGSPALGDGLPNCRTPRAAGPTWSWSADMRDGLPTSGDESAGGDAGAAVLVGEGSGVLAELVATASATDKFTDRWRAPGDRASRAVEERSARPLPGARPGCPGQSPEIGRRGGRSGRAAR